MNKPRICASIVDKDLAAIKEVEPLVDLFEVRIDLIGGGWSELVRELKKPWIACNRLVEEGGNWKGSEAGRIDELLKALDLGVEIVDIELRTENSGDVVKLVKKRAKCLVSWHELTGTPPLDSLKEVVERQLAADADICKVVTTAGGFEDNLRILQLIAAFPKEKIVTFAMGSLGSLSRVFCPLVGGYFTYASIDTGKESAVGQITVKDLRQLYEMMQ